MLNEKARNVATPWMTISEVAEYLSVSSGTVRNWISQKYIPHARRGRVVRFHRSEIDRWLSAGACRGRRTAANLIDDRD